MKATALLNKKSPPQEKEGADEDKRKLFLAVTTGPELHFFLEALFTANLSRKKNVQFALEIIVNEDHAEIARTCEIFQNVHVLQSGETPGSIIRKMNPDVLYIPDPNLKVQMTGLFKKDKIRIGGKRNRLLSFLSGSYQSNDINDLNRLKENGIDIVPESTEVSISAGDASMLMRKYGKLPEDFVWISIFDPHDLTASWPPGHTARLVRMLKSTGWQAVIPVPAEADARKVAEFRDICKEAVFLDNPSASLRAAGMSLASLVIGQAGAETLLATFLGKKVVELHDMRSRRIMNGESFKNKEEKKLKKAATYFTRTASSLKRHIMPPMHSCNEDCPSCTYNSCLEYISPERVFESVKRVLLPY